MLSRRDNQLHHLDPELRPFAQRKDTKSVMCLVQKKKRKTTKYPPVLRCCWSSSWFVSVFFFGVSLDLSLGGFAGWRSGLSSLKGKHTQTHKHTQEEILLSTQFSVTQKMRHPGVEPGSRRWQRPIIAVRPVTRSGK